MSSADIEQSFGYGSASGGGDPRVAAAQQWVSATPSRLARDSYGWMQAVHWVHGSGIYAGPRAHGPRFGATTVEIARLIAPLAECRPSVDWIARTLGISERTVQYHLGLLREAGLLAYVSLPQWRKGERKPRQAAVFARVIPPAFDTALGIRTVVEEGRPVQERRPVGIAEQARKLMAKLAAKAARKVKRRRRTKGSRSNSRCTPMQVPQLDETCTLETTFPSEAELASGAGQSPTTKKPKRRPRRVNRVGRRYQLAGELVRRVPWLGHMRSEGKTRLAWLVRRVADAGWTGDEVIAWLDLGTPPRNVRRPSGFLAHRLRAAVEVWPTKAARDAGRAAAADSRRAEQTRHADIIHNDLELPMNPRIAARVMAEMRAGQARYSTRQAALGLDDLSAGAGDAAADVAAFLGHSAAGAAR